jgi:hypothetical protein
MRFSHPLVSMSMLASMTSALTGAPWRAGEPGESYYMAVFAAQANFDDPSLTHTFATFVKVTGTGGPAKADRMEVHTISWMPQSLNIVILQRDPEPGTNLDLQSSLRWAASRNLRVSMWGPYRVRRVLYDRAVEQEARLRSGRVLYKAVDRWLRPGVASNCIHAVGDLGPGNGLLDAGQAAGDAASRQVVRHLSPWVIDGGRTHARMARRLGLKVDFVSPRDPEQRLLVASQ